MTVKQTEQRIEVLVTDIFDPHMVDELCLRDGFRSRVKNLIIMARVRHTACLKNFNWNVVNEQDHQVQRLTRMAKEQINRKQASTLKIFLIKD